MSVTVHVTIVVPTLKTSGALLVTDCTPQLSATIGWPKERSPAVVHPLDSALDIIGGGAVMVGFSASSMVIACVNVLMLPFLSVAFHLFKVVPAGKNEPEGRPLVSS